jgi:hypothetical protein
MTSNSISSPIFFFSCSYISLQQIGGLVSPALATISNSSHLSLLRLPAQESNDFSDGREGDWGLGVRARLIPPAEAAMVDVPALAMPRQSSTGTGRTWPPAGGEGGDQGRGRVAEDEDPEDHGERCRAWSVLDEGRPASDLGLGGGAV